MLFRKVKTSFLRVYYYIFKENLPSARYYGFQSRRNSVQWAIRLNGAAPVSSNEKASDVTLFWWARNHLLCFTMGLSYTDL